MGMERNNVFLAIIATAILVTLLCMGIGFLMYSEFNEDFEYRLEIEKENARQEVMDEKTQEIIIEKNTFVEFDHTKVQIEYSNADVSLGNRSYVDDIVLELTNEGKVKISFIEGDFFNSLKSLIERQGNEVRTKTNKTSLENVYEVIGFDEDEKVVDVFCGYDGDKVNYPIILFLMKDGTVQYINTKDCITRGEFRSKGTINGLENIIRMEPCVISKVTSGGAGVLVINDKEVSTVINGEYLNK